MAGLPNCAGVDPRVNVDPGEDFRLFMFVNNYNTLAGVQTAFQWDTGVGWAHVENSWNCRVGQLNGYEPCSENPPVCSGGARDGTISTAFDCVTGPAVALIGKMDVHAGTSGCLIQLRSSFPNGIHAVDCMQGVQEIDPATPIGQMRLGKICVGSGGFNACPPPDPVEPTTWGQIKATYGR